jgi:hypothetical protein
MGGLAEHRRRGFHQAAEAAVVSLLPHPAFTPAAETPLAATPYIACGKIRPVTHGRRSEATKNKRRRP